MDTFSSRHYIAIIFTTCIVSLKTYPTIFLIYGKRDSWIALIIASLLFIYFFMKIINIWKNTNTKNMSQVYTTVFGNKVGKLFIFLFIFTLFITLVESAAVEANSMRTNMMIETPVWYLLLFFIIPCLYVVRQDIVAIIVISLVLMLLIFLSGINLAIITAKYKKFQYLFPVFENGINIGFFICITKIFALYGCAVISLPYLSRIKDTSQIIKHAFIAVIVVIQMQIVSVCGMIMTFAPQLLMNMSYPKLIQTQLVSYQRFFEYGELYVLFQMLGGWLMKYIVTFYALILLLKELNLKRKQLILSSYIISFLVFVGAYIAANDTFLLFKLLNFYTYTCLVNFVIIPFLIFIKYSSIVKKGVKRCQPREKGEI
jgi:spore germination protein (amino acid permease)